MWQDQLQLKETENYNELFWEILRQEKSSKIKDKLAVQIRKEELLKEDAVDLVNADDIRKELRNRIYGLEKKCREGISGLKNKLQYIVNEEDIRTMATKLNNPLTILKEEEQLELYILKANLTKSDDELITDEIEKIRRQPRKTNQEYLMDADKAREVLFEKWGGTAYRGIGIAIGATLGGVVGTFLLPGLGTIVGGSLGGAFGLIFLGNKVNSFIVNELIPWYNAYTQTSKVRKLRVKRREAKSIRLHGLLTQEMTKPSQRDQNRNNRPDESQEQSLAIENLNPQQQELRNSNIGQKAAIQEISTLIDQLIKELTKLKQNQEVFYDCLKKTLRFQPDVSNTNDDFFNKEVIEVQNKRAINWEKWCQPVISRTIEGNDLVPGQKRPRQPIPLRKGRGLCPSI